MVGVAGYNWSSSGKTFVEAAVAEAAAETAAETAAEAAAETAAETGLGPASSRSAYTGSKHM